MPAVPRRIMRHDSMILALCTCQLLSFLCVQCIPVTTTGCAGIEQHSPQNAELLHLKKYYARHLQREKDAVAELATDSQQRSDSPLAAYYPQQPSPA